MIKQRSNGRTCNQVRPIKITYDVFSFGTSSVLFELANTKVLVTVSLQHGVPQFLRGKGVGWLTAEYALLPNATHVRTVRDASSVQKNGRTVEISRFIGRVLRTVFDAKAIGEQTIYVDCDVLQADGGTRTAAITAASLALIRAEERWLQDRKISTRFMKDSIAAVSVGVTQDVLLVDPDYQEDQTIDADFNVVVTRSNKCIEVQGGAEKTPISWEQFEQIRLLAVDAIRDIYKSITDTHDQISTSTFEHAERMKQCVRPQQECTQNAKDKVPLFSLQGRKTNVMP